MSSLHRPANLLALCGMFGLGFQTHAQSVQGGPDGEYRRLPQLSGHYWQMWPEFYTGVVTQYGVTQYATQFQTRNYESGPVVIPWPITDDVEDEYWYSYQPYVKNDTSCSPISETVDWNYRRSASSSVSYTNSSSYSFNAAVEFAAPIVEDVTIGYAYTQTSSTSIGFSETETISVTTPYTISDIDPCKKVRVKLLIREKTRTRGQDKFGTVFEANGPYQAWDMAFGDYGNFIGIGNVSNLWVKIGYGYEPIFGSATWVYETEPFSDPPEWIPDCSLNCGGVSDGDMDGDGIPDEDDPDMDGDGITNDHDPDRDGDGQPDWSDPDDDNDGILDVNDPDGGPDGSDDIDGDGTPNEDDFDVDGDGIPNAFETDPDDDLDGDGIPNSEDGDIDGDGVLNEDDDTPYGSVPTVLSWINGRWVRTPLF